LRERARGAMACHYADLLDATRERTFGRDGEAALADLHPELENVDVALDHLVARDPAYALRLLARTWRVMASLGHAGAALGRLRPLLDAYAHALSGEERADALDAAGSLAFNVGRRAEARRFYEAALPLRRSLEDPTRLAWTLINLNTLLVILGAWDAAAATFREVLDAGERAGPRWMNAAGLQQISWVATAAYDEALAATRTSLADAVRTYADAGDALTEVGARLALNDLLIRGTDPAGLLANLDALAHPLARLDATERTRLVAPVRGAVHLLEAFDRHDAAERLEALARTHLA
ncbi:MAG: tetratricopeptide repeat protein, partial [Trueperaceae bacterium]|nr:tetratricopeptide repeat protein [Trueperaceae bacterium]